MHSNSQRNILYLDSLNKFQIGRTVVLNRNATRLILQVAYSQKLYFYYSYLGVWFIKRSWLFFCLFHRCCLGICHDTICKGEPKKVHNPSKWFLGKKSYEFALILLIFKLLWVTLTNIIIIVQIQRCPKEMLWELF